MPAGKNRKFKKAPKWLVYLPKIGFSLIILAVIIVLFTYLPILNLEISYLVNRPDAKIPVSLTGGRHMLNPVDDNFGIIIPKIGANSKVIPNVDPFNSREYQIALTKGVAHAKGTVFPGKAGNSFIFAHSSESFYEAMRYNSVFYLLNKLEINDDIYVFVKQQKFHYKVTKKVFVKPNDISYIFMSSEKPILTLMTCWPPGTTLSRLIIESELIAD